MTEQLVVPRPYVSKVLFMAHTHVLGAHLGMDKTRERILDRFYWPGIKRDVTEYCQGCLECQRTALRPTTRSPLIPMPIIEVPFDRLALDIVGPLPKTSQGHRYILVMVDYATSYPEALPLRATTAKAVARELMLVFSRVGIAREILMDQGSCFMSQVLKELLSLLQVTQLRTSVYHPQTDGLIERFNKTLKSMLKKAMETDGKNWDQLLPHILFAVCKVPQASTGFSPFELLYGRRPRGLLDLAKEEWERQPSPHRTLVDHVEQVRERMAQVWHIVREHLRSAQQTQARTYNRGAQLHLFQPVELVLVLILMLTSSNSGRSGRLPRTRPPWSCPPRKAYQRCRWETNSALHRPRTSGTSCYSTRTSCYSTRTSFRRFREGPRSRYGWPPTGFQRPAGSPYRLRSPGCSSSG